LAAKTLLGRLLPLKAKLPLHVCIVLKPHHDKLALTLLRFDLHATIVFSLLLHGGRAGTGPRFEPDRR